MPSSCLNNTFSKKKNRAYNTLHTNIIHLKKQQLCKSIPLYLSLNITKQREN